MSFDQSLRLKSVDHLFRIQQALSKSNRGKQWPSANEKLSAYLRWQVNRKLNQSEQKLGVLKLDPPKDKLQNLTGLCPNCWSNISDYRVIPKRSKKKKKKNSKIQSESSNILCGKCLFCKSRVNFEGLRKAPKSPVKQVKNRSSSSAKESTSSKTKPSTKETLQKYLSSSKKKRNLDSKTRLSDFLQRCFDM